MALPPVVDPLVNLQNESSVVAKINQNAQRAADAIAKALSRNDLTENTMDVPLDMNGQRILNAPLPSYPTDVVRLSDVEDIVRSYQPSITLPVPGVVPLGEFNIKDIPGIDLTGATNNSLKIQATLDLYRDKISSGLISGVKVKFPFGSSCQLSSPLIWNADAPISFIGGDGSNRKAVRLIQTGDTLFSIQNTKVGASTSSNVQVEIGGFEIVTHSNASTAFKIYEPESLYAHDLRAYAGNGYWNVFFDLRNVRGSVIERMYVRNDHGLGTASDVQGIFVALGASVGSTDSRYSDMTIQGFDTFWYSSGTSTPGIEGQLFNGCAVVECNYGINWINNQTDGYTPPQLQFTNGHMNCYKTWINASKVAQLVLSYCTLELNGRFGDTNSGINLTGVNSFDISHNKMYFTYGGRNASAIVVATGCDLGLISYNQGVLSGATVSCMQFLVGSKNNQVSNCQFYTNGAIAYNNSGTNNLFESSSIRVLS